MGTEVRTDTEVKAELARAIERAIEMGTEVRTAIEVKAELTRTIEKLSLEKSKNRRAKMQERIWILRWFLMDDLRTV